LLILQILKIAGIILIVLLGIIFLLILLLLLFPWSYQLKGSLNGKEYEARLQIKWLFRAVYLEQNLKSGEEPGGILKIFGLRLFRSSKEVQEETKKLREERKPDPEVLRQVGASSSLFEDPVQNDLKQFHTDIPGELSQIQDKQEGTFSDAEKTTDGSSEAADKQKISMKTIREMWKTGDAPQPEELVHMLETKLEELIGKALAFTGKQARAIVSNGRTVLVQFFDDSRNDLDRLSELKELIFGTKNRKEMLLLWKLTGCVLRQILPRKGHGHLVFGVGDPYYTGKVLQVLALLYPYYGEVIEVCPWFDGEKLEADADVSGHIFLIVLLYCFIRVWFNRRIRAIYSDFMRIITNEQSE